MTLNDLERQFTLCRHSYACFDRTAEARITRFSLCLDNMFDYLRISSIISDCVQS